ncbi:MAG: hypothetical protein GF398_00140 [Chitinivibrionales bacterium]|nr:hypothetical protein [Chitinivibrionales bacterium]
MSVKSIAKNQGYAMMIALVVMVTIALIMTVVFRTVSDDVKSSGGMYQRTKAGYVAESAVKWGLSMAQASGFSLPTDSMDVAGLDCCTDPCGCGENYLCPEKFFEILESSKLYPNSPDPDTIKENGKTWIRQQTTDGDEALSGQATYENPEVIEYSIEYPADDVIRVIGKGTVMGKTVEARLTARITTSAGSPSWDPAYTFIGFGDMIPAFNTQGDVYPQNLTCGKIHVDGTIYTTNPKVGEHYLKLAADKFTSTNGMVNTISPYRTHATAKMDFINSHLTTNWRNDHLFPLAGGCSSIHMKGKDGTSIDYWDFNDPGTTEFNETDYSKPSIEDSLPINYLPGVHMSGPPASGPDNCDDCMARTVRYDQLPAYGTSIEWEWIYNDQYGQHREKREWYTGYHARSGNYNRNLSKIARQNPDITYGHYKEVGLWNDKDRMVAGSFETLAEHIPDDYAKARCDWHAVRFQGYWGGEWVRALWLDLSDSLAYPARCAGGGWIDFDTCNVIVVNGDSLLYPISIYSRGEIYLIGDFNVGYNARAHGVWDADLEELRDDSPRWTNGRIKGAKVVADSNRIWFLSAKYACTRAGFGVNSREGSRDGYRGRTGHPAKHTATNGREDGVVGVYVGTFVFGAPQINEAFYTFSNSHAQALDFSPPILEHADGSEHGPYYKIYGLTMMLQNGRVEGDWNEAKSDYDSYTDPNGYWGKLRSDPNDAFTMGAITQKRSEIYWGNFGDGWPPRPGYIAPRYGGFSYSALQIECGGVNRPIAPGDGSSAKQIDKESIAVYFR